MGSSVIDRLDLVIHALNGSVGKPGFYPGEDSIQVRPEHSHQFLERLQLRPHTVPFTYQFAVLIVAKVSLKK
jgi:hypothetical protein